MILAYTTELTVEQYELLASLLPGEAATGRPRTVNVMLVIQGILYILVSGCDCVVALNRRQTKACAHR